MLSGGLTCFMGGDPRSSDPIPSWLRVRVECPLVEWMEESKGYPVVYQRTFCGDRGDNWDRQVQAMAEARAFVRDNYKLHYTDSFWRSVAEREADEPFWAKAFLWSLEALVSVDRKLNQIFKD